MNTSYYGTPLTSDEIMHFGVKGMKWGVRRYKNPDGTLTRLGNIKQNKANLSKKKKQYKKLKKEYKDDVKRQYLELKLNKSRYGRMYVPAIRRSTAEYMVNNKMDPESARKAAIKKQIAVEGSVAGARLALQIAKMKLDKLGYTNRFSPGHKTIKGSTTRIHLERNDVKNTAVPHTNIKRTKIPRTSIKRKKL